MSVSLGPFMTCFVTILILTGYVHFIMKRNSALFRGTIKIVFGVIAVILLRMMVWSAIIKVESQNSPNL